MKKRNKKIVTILLAALMAFAITACGGDGEDSKDAEESKFAKYDSGEYAQLMASGKYYMDATAYTMGFEMDMKTAVDGENSATITDVMGYETKILVFDGKAYIIDDSNKTYSETDVESAKAQSSQTAVTDYSELEFSKDGKGAIPTLEDVDTEEYDYEEFVIKVDDEDEALNATVRYYMKDNALHAIYAEVAGVEVVMVINELTDEIPEDMLKLPDGYEKIEATV